MFAGDGLARDADFKRNHCARADSDAKPAIVVTNRREYTRDGRPALASVGSAEKPRFVVQCVTVKLPEALPRDQVWRARDSTLW